MEFPQNDDPAPADTPLGMLQRGRGAGWLAALDHEEGPQWLLACLARDPRRDGPLEERADYYATLALRLLVSPEAFANGPDLEDESLVYDVIEAMARRGSDVAAALIHSAHRADDEPGECAQDQWSEHRSAVETGASADAPIDIILEASWSCPIPDSLVDRLCTTCDAMEIDALRRAAQDVNGPGWRLALHVLARRGDLSPLDVVEKVLIKNESGLVRAWAFRFVTALKAEVALPQRVRGLPTTMAGGRLRQQSSPTMLSWSMHQHCAPRWRMGSATTRIWWRRWADCPRLVRSPSWMRSS